MLRADPNNSMNSSAARASPVERLEQTVQGEIATGNKPKYYSLSLSSESPEFMKHRFIQLSKLHLLMDYLE
ncbi:MAG: hypothetical protein M3261_06855, partial [Thermoproteota archaeon]|nr:hypothetical protein [Thermoproteota archaeon]